ncbi:MAG: DUF924 family protein [Pseudomonadota bacterium]
MSGGLARPADVLRFWFVELTPEHHFRRDAGIDAEIRARFEATVEAAARAELFHWRHSASGRLAEVIALDQFTRNLYRDDGRAFGADPLALALAQEAVARRDDQRLAPEQRVFLYMPYMHSESLAVHCEATRLFTSLGINSNIEYERRHRAIIERFGRYPHRNELLGRPSTPEEIEFLAQPGSSF